MIVVASGQVTNARRAFQNTLDDQGSAFVYADDAAMLRDLEHEVLVEDGQPKRVDGPFRQLLTTGGTLLLNLTSDEGVPRFTPQELESLNTLMEEQIWEGEPIACLDKGKRVTIVFLIDEDTPLTKTASGALASRVTLRDDFKAHTFTDAPDPVIHPPISHGTDTLVVDLQDDAASWQRTLFGGPELSDLQSWRHRPGALDGFDFSKQSLVLRNPPGDPRLMDLVLALQAKYPDAVRLEDGLPEDEAAERLARKQPATDVGQVLLTGPETVCTLHAGNFDEVLLGAYGAKHGALARLPGALSQAQAKAGTQLPVILVTEALTPKMWDRLMQHTATFAVAAAPGIRIDSRYVAQVAQADRAAWAPAPAPGELHKAETWSAPVTFLHSADPTLVDSMFPPGSTRIHVTPSMRSDELLYSLRRDPRDGAKADGQGLPGLQVQTLQLVEDLKAGKTVVLHGLENNPELARDVAPLLHPPHDLIVNGERIVFSGRLIVVTPDRQLVERHGLTAALSDPTPAGDAWRQAVTDRIGSVLSLSDTQAQALVAPVLEWFDTLQQAGALPRQQPTVRYATVETLCRTLSKLRAVSPSSDAEQARLVRSLVKDMLIGDFRRPDLIHDTQYAQLKACLKVLLLDEMSAMPPQSVELSRLKDLLGQVRHPQDVSALAWPFLNAFSPDVIKQVIGAPISAAVRPGTQADIGAKVLDLVCVQARAHGIDLPPLVAQLPQKPSPVEVRRTYTRPRPMSRDKKLTGKVRQAQAQGIFLKGPPGAGKTHLVETLTQGKPLFWASIADEGTSAFSDQLQAWATTQPPGTLVVDEANLARPENLAMLKGVFADRSLHVNGRLHALEANHQIIFTGNADSLPGRSKQQVAQESFATVQFKSMNTDFLRKAFVEPLLEHACSAEPIKGWITSDPSHRLNVGLQVAELGHSALEIHERLQKVFPGAGLSPRDLEEVLARALSQLTQGGSAARAQDLSPMLASVAFEVYGASLPDDSLAMVQAWLRHQLKVPATIELPELFDEKAIDRALQDQQLAPTKSTVALAGAVDGWLRSQAEREAFNPKDTTLGKRALLIEGPASRGKDAVVKATLQEGIDFVHLNANPNDLDGLRAAVTKARERGQVVLVSELNLLPSGILEGELNTLLTGQTGQPAAPGFALIATVNPGYAGRQTFSAALRNRMHVLKLQDYAPDELLPIARAHASKLVSARPSTPFGSSSASSTPAVPDHKIKDLVERHAALLGKLQGQAPEFRPGIRQLRDTLALLAERPTMTVEKAFAIRYSFYRSLAKRASVVQPASPKANEEQVARQLSAALGLAQPGMRQPAWRGDRTLSQATPMVYDAKRHELRFQPDAKPQDLTRFMLEEARQDRLFVGRLAAPEPLPASTAPVRFKPSTFHRSAVGRSQRTDSIGRIENLGKEIGYLATARTTVSGQRWAWAARHEDNATEILSAQDLRITLRDTPTEFLNGERRVYVPVPADKRPTVIRLGDHEPATVHRDEQGGWYVVAQGGGHSVGTVTYRLVEDAAPGGEEDHTPPDLPANFPDLAPAFNGPLAEKISSLSARRAQLGDIEVAMELAGIFKTTLEYSDDDAETLERTSSVAERCMRFLSIGQGVCHEFANSFAAVLKQSFGIDARLCHGHTARPDTGEIAAIGHSWVEVRDTQGHWHTVDPTRGGTGQESAAVSGTGDVVPQAVGRSNGAQGGQNSRSALPQFSSSGPNLFDESFHAELLNGISLDALGLTRGETQRGGAQYHPTNGVLEMKRLIAGQPDMFRRGALTDATEPRTLVIEDLPPSGNSDAWSRFWTVMARPLAALQRKGVPVLMRDNRGALQPAAFVRDIVARCGNKTSDPIGPLKDGAVILDKQSNVLLDKVATAYYESLLKIASVDLRRVQDVKLCILNDFSFSMTGRAYPFPIELTLHGQRIAITDADLDDLWLSAQQDIDRLNGLDIPAGRFAEIASGGADPTHDIERTLVRVARITYLRGMEHRSGFKLCKARLWNLVPAFIERAASLQEGALVGVLSIESRRLPPRKRAEKVHGARVLTDLLASSTSKSAIVEDQIACAVARALADLLVSKERQADVLNHLEQRHALGMPAASQAIVLNNLIVTLGCSHRTSLEPAALLRCRTLCSRLADSAAEHRPRDLQALGANLSLAYAASDDTATKSWALSILDKLSRAMQALPMDYTHNAAVYLCHDLHNGKLKAVEHQQTAAQILERLVEESHQVRTIGKGTMDDRLEDAINGGIIATGLIPRYQAIHARVKQAQAVN